MRSLFSYQKLKVHLFLGVSQGYAFEFFDCLFFFFPWETATLFS